MQQQPQACAQCSSTCPPAAVPAGPSLVCTRRHCIHAACAASTESASSAASSAATSSHPRDRRFLRRRLGANTRPFELETPPQQQQQRLLASKAAAAASAGGAVECSQRLGQVRQLHANRGLCGDGLGIRTNATPPNKQTRFEYPPAQRRWVVRSRVFSVCLPYKPNKYLAM